MSGDGIVSWKVDSREPDFDSELKLLSLTCRNAVNKRQGFPPPRPAPWHPPFTYNVLLSGSHSIGTPLRPRELTFDLSSTSGE